MLQFPPIAVGVAVGDGVDDGLGDDVGVADGVGAAGGFQDSATVPGSGTIPWPNASSSSCQSGAGMMRLQRPTLSKSCFS